MAPLISSHCSVHCANDSVLTVAEPSSKACLFERIDKDGHRSARYRVAPVSYKSILECATQCAEVSRRPGKVIFANDTETMPFLDLMNSPGDVRSFLSLLLSFDAVGKKYAAK